MGAHGVVSFISPFIGRSGEQPPLCLLFSGVELDGWDQGGGRLRFKRPVLFVVTVRPGRVSAVAPWLLYMRLWPPGPPVSLRMVSPGAGGVCAQK